MPSLIGAPGTPVAANYRQQIVPFSRFGTRKVAWYKIGHTDFVDGGGNFNMVNFNKIIDTIQTRMEIVMVGAPYIDTDTGWNKFVVAVFEDTANNGNDSNEAESGYNPNATTLQTALEDLNLGGQGPTVRRIYLYGAPGNGDTGPDSGFAEDSDRREYDTKAEYVNSSYTQNNC